MPYSYEQLIDELENRYDEANQAYSNTVAHRFNAWLAWAGGNDHTAIGHLISMGSEICNYQAGIMAWGDYGYPAWGYALVDALHPDRAFPVGDEVDFDAIINLMLAADFSQFQKFVGILDGYRTALWNQPFNVDFYAALARGFM